MTGRDPKPLAEILAALELPSREPLGRFVGSWMQWVDDDGFSVALPERWQIRVLALVALGLSNEDLDHCVREAMTRSYRIDHDGLFPYAVAVGWGLASERLGISQSPQPPAHVGVARQRVRGEDLRGPAFTPDPDYFVSLGPMIMLTRGGKVHLSTCRTLATANPAWAVAVTSIVPFHPCQTCLGGRRFAGAQNVPPVRPARQAPSPQEIAAAERPAGGWLPTTLVGWGVPLPPPPGWQAALYDRWLAENGLDTPAS